MNRIDIEGETSGSSFDFTVSYDDRNVPATFWQPRDRQEALPALVLLQHGGPFHKRHERSNDLASTLVARTGAAVLLIDGPVHGRRRQDEPGVQAMLAEFEHHWRQNPGIENLVQDWRRALDAVVAEGWADPERVVWFGMSMGTAYGVPLCAAEPRVKAAALGMWGTDWGQEAALLESARVMKTPVLFQIKSEDEIFSVEGQRELFDAIGSADKSLHTFPGSHSLTAPGQLDQLLEFTINALGGTAARISDAKRPAGGGA